MAPKKAVASKVESESAQVASTEDGSSYTKAAHKVEDYEFGGPIGVTALMIWSHYILIYFW